MEIIRKLGSPWVIVTLLLATYVTSYFALSEYYASSDDQPRGKGVDYVYVSHSVNVREFKHSSMADFFRPITYVESKVRGEAVIAW